MLPATAIPIAAGDGPGLDVIIWLVAGGIWFLSQIAAAKRRKAKQDQRRQAAGEDDSPARSFDTVDDSPDADELAEIFKRLGSDIPSTPRPPPPAPKPAPAARTFARPPAQAARRAAPRPAPLTVEEEEPCPYEVKNQTPYRRRTQTPYAQRVEPNIARRLARAKEEAAAAAREAEQALKITMPEFKPDIHARADDSQATQNATRTTGLVLPRLHAMDLRFTPFPSVPMPAYSRVYSEAPPLPIRLHGKRQLRDAIVAQTLLHPPKSQARI